MSNFTAEIQAKLNTSGVASDILAIEKTPITLKNITSDTSKIVSDIQNALSNNKFTINLGNLNLSGLTNQAQKAGTTIGNNFANSINSSLNKIHLVNGGIGNVSNMLQGAGFNKSSINSITQDLDKMILTVKKINTTQSKNGNIKIKISGIDEVGRAVDVVRTFDKETGKVVNTTKSFAQSFSSTVKGVTDVSQTLTKSSTLSNNIQTWMNKNTKAAETFGTELKDLQKQLNGNSDATTLKNTNLKFQNIKSQASALGITSKSGFSSIKDTAKQLLGLTSAVAVFHSAVNVAKDMYQSVYEVDSAMVNLKKVTDETDATYSSFLSRSTESAQKLGTTVSNLITQTSEWAKLGYSLKEAESLSKISSVYANVGEVSNETAVSDMVTAMKAFNIEADDASHIVDIYNELGNNFAVSSADIGEGLSNSASALALAGADIEEASAMITGIAEITQNAPEAGNALKIFSMRIRGMKGELEELGEDVDDDIESISKVQTQILNLTGGKVNIFDENGEFRDYYTIMEEIASIYNDLSSTNQSSLSEILFGKQRGNAGAALIQAFQNGQITKAYESAVNSAGSAAQEQERWMGSLEAKTQQLKAAWEDLSVSVLNSDFLKAGISGLTGIVNVVDNLVDGIGVLGTIGAGAGIIALVKSLSTMAHLNSLGVGLSGASGLFSSLAASIGISTTALGGFIAAAAGIYAVVKIFDALNESFSEAQEKSAKSREEYASTQSEIESLNSELETTNARIDELNGKGSLTVVEQAELEKLNTLNEQLQTQIALKQKVAGIEQKQAAEDAKNVLTKEQTWKTGDLRVNPNGTVIDDMKTGDIIDKVSSQQSRLNAKQEEYNTLLKRQSEFTEEDMKPTSAWGKFWGAESDYERNQRQIEEVSEEISNLEGDIAEGLSTISVEYDSLFDEDGNVLSGYEDVASRVKTLISETTDDMQKAEEVADKINEVVDSTEDFKKAQEDLQDMAKSGDITFEDVIDKYPELAKALRNAGINLKDFANDINASVSKSSDGIETTSNSIDDLTTTLSEFQEVQSQIQSAMDASKSATGLTSEDVTNLTNAYKGLKSFDAAKLFEQTSNGIHLNTEELERLNEEYSSAQLEQYTEKIRDLQKAISEERAKGNDTSALENELSSVQMLKSEYDGLLSAYNQWVTAKSGSNERDSYESVGSSYKEMKQTLDEGWYGDSALNAYLDLLLSAEQRTDDAYNDFQKLNQTIEGTSHSIMDYWQYDDDELNTDGLFNFLEDVNAVLGKEYAWQDKDGLWNFDFDGGKLQEVADKFGVSTEAVEMFQRALIDAGASVNLGEDQDYYIRLNTVTNGSLDSAVSIVDRLKALTATPITAEVRTVNESEIQTLATELASLPESVQIAVGVSADNVGSAQGIISQLNTNPSSIQVPVNYVKQSDPDTVDTVEGKANYTMGTHPTVAPTISGTANYRLGSYPTSLPTLYQSVIAKKIGFASGTAHANGTALWNNYRDSIGAYSSGALSGVGRNWSLLHNENALVNELGTESIVRDGRWYPIPGGAHIAQLKKGDIIFSASQTKELLRTGKVSSGGGHGQVAHADGTAYNTLNIGAYWSGSGARRRTTTTSSSNSTSSSSNSSNTSTSSSSSKSTKSSKKSSKKSSSSNKGSEVIDWIEIAIERIEQAIDNLATTATSSFKKLATRLSATNQEITKSVSELTLQQKAYDRYMKKANSISLSSDLKKKVQNGTIDINGYNKKTAERIKDYQEWYEKAIACKDAIIELKESIAELYEQKFDDISSDYENQLSLMEHLTNTYNNGIDDLEERGYLASTKYYESLRSVEQQNINVRKQELADLTKQMSEAINSGYIEVYSESWYQFQQDINDVKEAIQESEMAMVEFSNSIRDANWERFDYLQERISDITEEAEFLIDLMENSDLYTNNGQLTNTGMATMGLHVQSYNVAMAQADKYAEELLKVNEEIANDPNNTELLERRQELLEAQQDSILAAEDEKQAIADMVSDGIELELDALQDLIDKYEDSMDAADDLYTYQKKLKEQTSEIASLQKQLAAYTGDTSEETRATVQKLKVDLSDAMEDLEETQYDHYVDEQKKLLDNLYDEYEAVLNERLDNIDVLLADMISSVNTNSSSICDTLLEQADKVGYTITDNQRAIWSNEGVAYSTVAKYGESFLLQMTSVNDVVSKIATKIGAMSASSENSATATIGATTSTTATTPKATTQTSANTTATTATTTNNTKTTTTKFTNAIKKGVAAAIWIFGGSTSGWGSGTTRTKRLKEKFGASNANAIKKYIAAHGKNGDLRKYWKNNGKGNLSKYYYKAFKTGGLADYTGMAWLDGTPNKPELVLNSDDTKNFVELRDVLRDISQKDLSIENSSYNNFDSAKLNGLVDVSGILSGISRYDGGANNSIGEINITIPIDHVQDYNDFMNQMKNDDKFQKFVEAMTVDRLVGKSKLAKSKYQW